MATRKKKIKKVTVAELQSYVQGAIDLNDTDWHPDKSQWDKIVEMIMNVKEEAPRVERVVQQAPPPEPQLYQQQPQHQSSAMGGRPGPERIDMRAESGYRTERISSPESQGAIDGTPVTKSGIKVKTPDIDTPVYDTPFT